MNKTTYKEKTNDPARHPDPITHAPGSHPVGAGIGAAAGGAVGVAGAVATGAAVGSPAGPVGAVVGAVVGGVVGGLAGKGIAEEVNPSVEHDYWRKNYSTRPYSAKGSRPYEEYGPAYQYGWESYGRYAGREFDDVEGDLERDWDHARGESKLNWEHAKQATRDAWDRVAAKYGNKNKK